MADNERLSAMDPRLRLKISPPQAGLETVIARSVGQRFSYYLSGLLYLQGRPEEIEVAMLGSSFFGVFFFSILPTF